MVSFVFGFALCLFGFAFCVFRVTQIILNVGGWQNRDRQCKMGQCPQRAAWRVQTEWEEKISRREAQPWGRLLERLWKFCPLGFYGSEEEAKLSLIWSGESSAYAGGGPLGLWKLSSNSFLDRVKK